MAAYARAKVTQRERARFHEECTCTKALHEEYAQRHKLNDRVLVIDGGNFRWEGLGNSGTRWMGLLRWGYSTGRAVYLKTSKNPETHLDLGDYFTGYGSVDWHWRSRAAEVRRQFAARGIERPLVMQYGCAQRARGAPGCALTKLRLRNGTTLTVDEPAGLLRFMRDASSAPWIKLVLAQQVRVERCKLCATVHFRVRAFSRHGEDGRGGKHTRVLRTHVASCLTSVRLRVSSTRRIPWSTHTRSPSPCGRCSRSRPVPSRARPHSAPESWRSSARRSPSCSPGRCWPLLSCPCFESSTPST